MYESAQAPLDRYEDNNNAKILIKNHAISILR